MPEKKDESGNTYGRLLVLREATIEERGDLTGGAYWLCQCLCGNQKIINGHSLRSGSTTSCGCLNKEIVSRVSKKKVINEIGNRYGRLQVIARDENATGVKWICQCDCGNTKSIDGKALRSGVTKSCGCIQKEVAAKTLSDIASSNYKNETGRKFGKLKVISIAEKQADDLEGVYFWCKCDCGRNELVRARGVDLRNGHIQSCGCLISASELVIEKLLKENNIDFKRQFSFNDLFDKSSSCPLRFDFAVFNNNVLLGLIEYNGRQHYDVIDYFGGKEQLIDQKRKDEKKYMYCRINNIPLIVIPYTKEISIDDLLFDKSKYRIV